MEDIHLFLNKINENNYTTMVDNRISEILKNNDDFINYKKMLFEKQLEKHKNPKYIDPINPNNITFHQYFSNKLTELQNNPQKFINEEIEILNNLKKEYLENGN